MNPEKAVCETCGKTFGSPGHLRNHIRLAHVERKASKEPVMQMTTEKETRDIEKQPKTQSEAYAETKASSVTLTPDERALVDQITRSKDDWHTIDERDILDFSLAEDPLKLPPEAKERQDRKEFAFRWCERTPKRVAELTNASLPLRWWVANSTTTPYLAKYIDPTIGGILKLDQILLMKPWSLHQKVKDAVADAAKALYNSRELQKGGAQKLASHDTRDHIKPITGERARIRGGDIVYRGEAGEDSVSDLIAQDEGVKDG